MHEGRRACPPPFFFYPPPRDAAVTAPFLIFAWGNPSRGDDALGPLFVDRLLALFPHDPGLECLTDFQLQVEHALDLQDRRGVLFVDASLDAEPPFTLERIEPREDRSLSTHALSPQAVLQVYRELQDSEPPPSWQLAIRAHGLELGSPLSPEAEANLEAAVEWFREWRAGVELGE